MRHRWRAARCRPSRRRGRSGLIQNHHQRLGEHRPRNREPLALPSRQPRAVLPELRRVTLGQRHDELVRRGPDGRLHGGGLVRLRMPIAQIIENRAAKQHRRVLDHHDAPAQVGEPVASSGRPSSRMRPASGSTKRRSRSASVDLPAPEAPSSTTLLPAGISSVIESRTAGPRWRRHAHRLRGAARRAHPPGSRWRRRPPAPAAVQATPPPARG